MPVQVATLVRLTSGNKRTPEGRRDTTLEDTIQYLYELTNRLYVPVMFDSNEDAADQARDRIQKQLSIILCNKWLERHQVVAVHDAIIEVINVFNDYVDTFNLATNELPKVFGRSKTQHDKGVKLVLGLLSTARHFAMDGDSPLGLAAFFDLEKAHKQDWWNNDVSSQ